MAELELTPILIEEFMGLVTEPDEQDVAKEYAVVCRNAKFAAGKVGSRPGTIDAITLGAGSDIYQAEWISYASSAIYYFFLMDDFNLYYSTGGARTLLITTSGSPKRFSVAVYGDFVYFFFNDGNFGVDGPYVWDPSVLPTIQTDLATIAPAAIGTMSAATSGAGSVDAGAHKIKVVFETRTGYRSSPTTGTVTYTATASDSIDLTNIPLFATGGGHAAAECTKRHIVMTEAGGDTYFIALTIANNSATTGTIDISDADLNQGVEVTDYFQFTSPLPEFAIGFIYHNRLCCAGNVSEASLLYVSELDSPQTFRADVGFLNANRDDGYRIYGVFPIRDVLYIVKQRGLYATQDNGVAPNSWPLAIYAEDVGTNSFGGVTSLTDENFAVILDFKGLYLFTGSPPIKLTADIQPTWDTISIPYSIFAEVRVDTLNRRVHCLIPTGAATRPDKDIVVDYSDGWDKAKWSIWQTAGLAWRSIIFASDGTAIRGFVAVAGSTVQRFDETATSDDGTAIDYAYRTGIIEPRMFGMNLFGGISMHAYGAGTLGLSVYGPDGTLIVSPTGFTLSTTPEQDLFRRINVRTERIFLEFSHNSASSYSNINRLAVYAEEDGVRSY